MSIGFVSSDPLNNLTNVYQRPVTIYASRAPTANDIYPPNTAWVDKSVNPYVIYVTNGSGSWAQGGTAGVSSIAGTANQVALSASTGSVVVSLVGPYTPSTYAANGILFGAGSSSIAATASVNNGVLVTSNAGVPSLLANGTAGFVLTANSGAPPSWQAAGGGGGVTSAVATANQVNVSAATGAVTFSLSATLVVPGTFTSTAGQNSLGLLDVQGTTTLNTTGSAVTTIGNATGQTSVVGGLKAYRPIGTAITSSTGLVLAQAGQYLRVTSGTVTITVPLNATQAFPIGTEIDVFNNSGNTVTFAATGGVTINSSALTLATNKTGATLKKVGTDEWDLVGLLS